jgi:hypothetical protein
MSNTCINLITHHRETISDWRMFQLKFVGNPKHLRRLRWTTVKLPLRVIPPPFFVSTLCFSSSTIRAVVLCSIIVGKDAEVHFVLISSRKQIESSSISLHEAHMLKHSLEQGITTGERCSHFSHALQFWEELIVYFPWYDTGHIENDVSNNSSIVACVFVAEVTFLPSRCLATIGGYTYRHRLMGGIF